MRRKGSIFSLDFCLLVIVLFVYAILGYFLLRYYRYQINPDAVSYISIAQKYLDGDFSNAVNGYWGPLFSWLLIPFFCFGVDMLLTTKLLSLFIGFVTIVALRALSYRFEMTESVRTVILFSAVPVVLTFAFFYVTPDLLLTCILLFYLAVIFDPSYADRAKAGIFCGALGGVAYLSKSFAFPFFISHFFMMNALIYFRSETKQTKKKVLRNFLTGAVLFALISGVWVGLISNKYGKLMLGGSGQAALRGVAAPGGRGSAVLWQGFLKLPNETAVSAWEDPCYLEMPPYNPLESWSNFVHELKVIATNLGKTARIFMDFSLLSIAIGAAYVFFWLRRRNLKTIQPEVLYPTVTVPLIVGGYSVVLIEARYIWTACILLMLMGGYVLSRLFRSKFFAKVKSKFFAKVTMAALLIIFFLSFAVPASRDLRRHAYVSINIYILSRMLGNIIAPDCNIASNNEWAGSMCISYLLGCRYYGAQKADISEIELIREMIKYDITYYFYWGYPPGNFVLPRYCPEVTRGCIPGLRIYRLKRYR